MLKKTVVLNRFGDVKAFSAIAQSKNYDIFLSSGGKRVNARFIEEVFELDLTKPVFMEADCEMVAELSKQIEPFLLKKEK